MDSDESYGNASFMSDDEERPSQQAVPPVGFSKEAAVKRDEPVQLVSIKPLVEYPTNETESSDADVEQTSRRTGRDLSKYNWKNFLPITRR